MEVANGQLEGRAWIGDGKCGVSEDLRVDDSKNTNLASCLSVEVENISTETWEECRVY